MKKADRFDTPKEQVIKLFEYLRKVTQEEIDKVFD